MSSYRPTEEYEVKQDQACTCREHQDGAPTTIRGLTFTLFSNAPDAFSSWWRWRCSCGSAGQWQGQSPSVSYHQWLKHLGSRKHGLPV